MTRKMFDRRNNTHVLQTFDSMRTHITNDCRGLPVGANPDDWIQSIIVNIQAGAKFMFTPIWRSSLPMILELAYTPAGAKAAPNAILPGSKVAPFSIRDTIPPS